jgi:two-component system, OmpR family, alkaline phosphatase synthesis response regulator PhoP
MPTVLVVDDDSALRESVAEVLSAEGYTVLQAANGEEGYSKAKEARPDVMLLDVMMSSNREGFDIAKRLKQDETTRNIPVIIVTGIKKAMRLPFSYEPDEDWLPVKAVLEKPVQPDQLIKHVKEAIA